MKESNLTPPSQANDRPSTQPHGWFSAKWLTLLVVGLGITLFMLTRSQIERDGLALIARGWLLVYKGIWVPFGNPVAASSGGYLPGGLTALLFGAPLAFWPDHRAAAIPILVTHIIAFLLLDRLLRENFDSRARLVFAILYWLNPWRLYLSVWVDNSGYVFLTGAIHLWATYRQRHRSSFVLSMVLALTLGLSLQLHLDAVLLAIASIPLWWRGYWKPHWPGLAVGTLLVLLTLIPYISAVSQHPEILPGSEGRIGASLLMIYPPFKGVLYWLRFSSLSFPTAMLSFDFTPAFGAKVDLFLTPVFYVLGKWVGPATILIALFANLWLWRQHRRSAPAKMEPTLSRWWLGGYSGWVLAACFLSNAISPTAIMWWHNLIAFHAAVLPLLLWSVTWPAEKAVVRWGLPIYAVLCVAMLLGMAVAAEQYRRGGRDGLVIYLHDHEILHDLPLARVCDIRPSPDYWPNKKDLFYQKYLVPYRLPAHNAPAVTKKRRLDDQASR